MHSHLSSVLRMQLGKHAPRPIITQYSSALWADGTVPQWIAKFKKDHSNAFRRTKPEKPFEAVRSSVGNRGYSHRLRIIQISWWFASERQRESCKRDDAAWCESGV